jgi:hypothetical protein
VPTLPNPPSPRPRPLTDHEVSIHEVRSAGQAARNRLRAESEMRRLGLEAPAEEADEAAKGG